VTANTARRKCLLLKFLSLSEKTNFSFLCLLLLISFFLVFRCLKHICGAVQVLKRPPERHGRIEGAIAEAG